MAGDDKHDKSEKIVIENEETAAKSVHDNLANLSGFKVTKVLHTNTERKAICLQGTFSNDDKNAGIILLEKTGFEEEKLKSNNFFSEGSVLTKQFHNDVYGNYECFAKAEFNGIKTTIIHPATEDHILKYSVKNVHIVDETPYIYKDIVLPYLNNETFNLQWVYNILEHKSESERIVFEDPDPEKGFILVPDLKWDEQNLEALYLLAITNLRDIKSLRDLRSEHLNLLKNIYKSGTKAIQEKYGIDSSCLRIYLHYHPSFYHCHVHFTNLQHHPPGIFAERAHMLSNVISNIKLVPDYYQKVTLPVVVFENSKLFNRFEKEGILKKVVKFLKNMKIPVKHIFAEVRPVLQSVNVYVVFTEILQTQVKVELTINGFDLTQNDLKESVEFFTETKKTNLILLSAKQNYLVFRFNFSNFSIRGGLKVEVLNLEKSILELKIDNDKINTKLQIKDVKVEEENMKLKIKNLNVEVVKKIECKSGCVLNHEDITRAFKSPHFDYEPNEWFCHAHNVPDYSLKPNIFELQITDYGFYVDKKLVDEGVENRERKLFCKKCKGFLGREVNKGIYKFYPDTVKTVDKINVDETLKIDNSSIKKSVLEGAQHLNECNISLYSTLKIITDSAERNLGKVILTTSELNPKRKPYLFVWVAEQNLLTYKTDEFSKNLKEEFVNKVLFQYEDNLTPVVDKWCKDFSTVLIDVSESMLEETLRYLNGANSVIPEEFGSANGLSVSFFSL